MAAPGGLDPLDAHLLADYVEATSVQPDGKIIIAGWFSSVLGVTRNGIARLNADGTLDAGFNPNPNAGCVIFSVALQADGKIVIAGGFTTLQPNGAGSPTARGNIARLNADGSLDTGFDPKANATLYSAVLQSDGKVLLGGSFTTLQPNGAASATVRNRIARVNADGTLDTGFDPNANAGVNTIAVQPDGKVLIGGSFTQVQPNGAPTATPRSAIVRVNADGTLDAGFDPNPTYGAITAAVQTIAVQPDGKVVFGGGFTEVQPNGAASPTTRTHLVRVNANGTLDIAFSPNPDQDVYSLALQADGKLLIAGNFNTVNARGLGGAEATARKYIARLGDNGLLDITFTPEDANSFIDNVMLQADGKVLIGGSFSTFQPSGTTRVRFARLLNDVAVANLVVQSASKVTFARDRAAPEVSEITFALSVDDGATWSDLGAGTRVTGGWEITGLSLPATGKVRARGRTHGGNRNNSSGLVDRIVSIPVRVASVTSTNSDGIYKIGDTISIQVNFTKPVFVENTAALFLATPYLSSDRFASYSGGSGTSTITLTYVVQNFDESPDLDYFATTSLYSGGYAPSGFPAAIRDADGNYVNLTLPAPGAAQSLSANKNLVLDGVSPRVTTVTSSPSFGTAKIGDSFSIRVNFHEPVFVTGVPQLTLETGVTDRTVNYSGGSGTSVLSFTYTVQAGDSSPDLDYQSTAALAFNGGTIKDAAGNDAILTLTPPGTPFSSLGYNSMLVIDGVVPTLTGVSIASSNANPSRAKVGDTVTVTFTASEALTAAGASIAGRFALLSGSGNTYTATTTVLAGDPEGAVPFSLTFTDLAGNVGVPVSATTNATSVTVDKTAPTLSAVSIASNNATPSRAKVGDAVTVTFTASEALAMPTAILAGRAATVANTSGNTYTASTTLLAGDAEGVVAFSLSFADLAGNAGTAVTTTTNASVVTFDRTAPVAPVFTAITNDTGVSATDFVTSDPTLVLSGTAEANSTVTLSRLGTGVLGTVTANGSGAWSYDYTGTTLAAGDHSFTATAADAAGNVSPVSTALIVTVDTANAAPVIAAISTDTGSSATDGITSDTTLTLSGTAEANSVVTLTRSGIVGPIGTATANGSGAWSFVYATVLVDGSYLFNASSVDVAGNTSAVSADFPVVIDTAAPVVTSATTATATYQSAFTYTVAASGTAGNTGQAALTLTVAPASLTVAGITAADKTYDATPAATLTTTGAALVGVASGDVVTLGTSAAVGVFADKLVGTGKTVTVSGLTLGGAAAANYTLVQPTATARISARGLTVTGITAANKTFDGSTSATLSLGSAALVGIISGDTVTLVTAGATGAFATAAVGSNQTVTVSGLTLAGTDAANYLITPPTTTATISAVFVPPPPIIPTVSVAITGLSQTYDGTPKSVTVTPSSPVTTTVVYSTPGGNAPTNAGSYQVTVSFFNGVANASSTATLVIAKAPQTVAFSLTGSDFSVGSTLGLVATASSGLPVTFSVVSGTASLSGSSVSITTGGAVSVRASQAGNDNYLPASADQGFTGVAAKAAQTIAFAALSNRKVNDGALSLSATASSGLPVSFSVSGPATVSGNTLALTGTAGLVTVRASQAGNATFAAAPDVFRAFVVIDPAPSIFFGDLVDDPGVSSGEPGRGELQQSTGPRLDAKSGDIAAVLFADTRRGTVLIVAPNLGLNVSLDFALTDAGTYSVAFTSGGQPFTLTGALNGTTLTGRIPALRVSFSTQVQTRTGTTGAIAGFYQSSTLDAATGGTTSIIGPNGQLLIVATTGTVSTGALGTVAANGAFNVSAPGATISGAVDASTTTLSGTIAVPNQAPVSFSGISAITARTDRLINLSSRVLVGPSVNRTFITGFVLGGGASKRVLLRAVGPALSGFGVQGALANPRLQLFDAAGKLLLENDDWSGTDTAATAAQVGAFSLVAGSKDAALFTTLAPGAYTMQVIGGADTGVALAEIYDASTSPNGEPQRLVNISTRGEAGTGENVLIGG
ncbi:MAG: YDG domain-containing protein, partial [Verrucomicrobia bacterium]|nr:YDG domain-containing protein [Verrucomicrobiota bacterium]